MNLWSDETTLHQAKHILDNMLQCDLRSGSVQICNLFTLTKPETILLAKKLSQINSQETFRECCICLIVAWTFAFYNDFYDEFKQQMLKRYNKIPQHALGIYLKTFRNTFDEYGLDTFGLGFTSMSAIEQMIRQHAGVPER